MKLVSYHQLTGALQQLATQTRPGIAPEVGNWLSGQDKYVAKRHIIGLPLRVRQMNQFCESHIHLSGLN